MDEATVAALESLARTSAELDPELRDRALDQFRRGMERRGCPPEAIAPYSDLVRRRIAELAGEVRAAH